MDGEMFDPLWITTLMRLAFCCFPPPAGVSKPPHHDRFPPYSKLVAAEDNQVIVASLSVSVGAMWEDLALSGSPHGPRRTGCLV